MNPEEKLNALADEAIALIKAIMGREADPEKYKEVQKSGSKAISFWQRAKSETSKLFSE